MAKNKKQRAKHEERRQAALRANAQRGRVTLAASPWDHGATGLANRIGLVEEERGEVDPKSGKVVNPNKVTGVRRVDLLEVWHRRGVISTAGFNAAQKLRGAFEATQRSAGWPDNDRVQSSPKPDHAVAIQIDRIIRYARLGAHVTREDWPLIEACVLDGKTPAAIKGYAGRDYQIGLVALHNALERISRAMEARK